MDKRRLFQNETHFIYNPQKQKMNQLFDHKEVMAAFPAKFGAEWSVVQEKIYDSIKSLFALAVHESPDLKDPNVSYNDIRLLLCMA